MRMITCKMRVSIPVLWYVQALCAYNQLILAKILDITRGLRYLHNHPKGSWLNRVFRDHSVYTKASMTLSRVTNGSHMMTPQYTWNVHIGSAECPDTVASNVHGVVVHCQSLGTISFVTFVKHILATSASARDGDYLLTAIKYFIRRRAC